MPVDPALTAEALVLVQAQAKTREQIAAATTAGVVAGLRAFLAAFPDGAGWRNPADVTRLAKQLAATTRAGQRQTSTSTAAYWARMVTLLTGQRPSGVRLVDPAAVRPVPLDSVFGRLADQARWLEASRGVATSPDDRLRYAVEAHRRQLERRAATLDRPGLGEPGDGLVMDVLGEPGEAPSMREIEARLDALLRESPPPTVAPDPLTSEQIDERLITRASSITDSVLSETMRAQIEAAARRDPSSVTAYRRVPHPELGQVCGLCLSVSTRLFTRGNLLPLHPACRCTVTPVVGPAGGDGDVGGAINEADLSAIYAEAGGTTAGRDLSATRFRVVRHPERGPILVAGGGSTIPLLPQGA